MFAKLFGTSKQPHAQSLVDLTKKAAVSLEKNGLSTARAAVYLVLDRSASMRPYYKDGSVQRLAEQALGLSANLDDDGTVPVIFFSGSIDGTAEVTVDDFEGRIAQAHARLGRMGSTNYTAAISTVIEHHQHSGYVGPAFVIFQSDGNPDNRSATAQALREASKLPLFWAFVGFGERISFLERLDDLDGRVVDNAGFFHAADPRHITDSELYDGLTRDFGPWLTAAGRAGILS
ncbi:VWA domain-containing protein [Streptomyces sp. NPDC021100]|uniref:VWA domain-containing protein n=1 Tax=Streptomyces sp. NPDC021100 TaxID=3365114 RepID=UPI0037AD525C